MILNTKKKKILFIIPNLSGGGVERVFVNYIRSLDQKKYEIQLVLIEKTGPLLELVPSYVTIIDIKGTRTRYSFFKLLKCIRQNDPHLIVCTTNYLNILLLFVSFFISRKIIICLYEPSMPSAQFGEKYFPQYYKWLMKLLYKYADYIIAQTHDMKIEIEKYYSSPKNQIIVTINPIDIALIKEQISDAINPYDDNHVNIIVSGRISEEKGQTFVLKSFVNVVKQNPNFKLYLLGNISNQSYYQKVKSIILNNNIENNVEFIGFKTNPFPYYKFADLLVLPSKWEGLPNVVLEALYLQTPVVVTDCIPFFNELLSVGKNGFIVKYGDESDLADKILKYNQLDVHSGLLNLPNYDEIFWDMLNK